jgi:hypothetical protein
MPSITIQDLVDQTGRWNTGNRNLLSSFLYRENLHGCGGCGCLLYNLGETLAI